MHGHLVAPPVHLGVVSTIVSITSTIAITDKTSKATWDRSDKRHGYKNTEYLPKIKQIIVKLTLITSKTSISPMASSTASPTATKSIAPSRHLTVISGPKTTRESKDPQKIVLEEKKNHDGRKRPKWGIEVGVQHSCSYLNSVPGELKLNKLSWSPAFEEHNSHPWSIKKIKHKKKKLAPLGASTVAALVLVLKSQTLQPGRNLLFSFHQDVQQVFGDVTVLVIVKGSGQTCKTQLLK